MATLNELKMAREQARRRYTNPTCADCGAPIRPDYWQPPETSLCPECEERVRKVEVAWLGPVVEK